MCLPLQIKEKKKKKKDDIQQANGRSGPKVNPHCCCFPASDCRCQLSPSSQHSTAAPRLQCPRSLDCNHRVEPQDWAHVDCENLLSLECTRSACEVSLFNQSLTFHRAFLFLVLRVDHHGAQLGWQGVIVLDHRIGPITHAAGYADGAHLIPCRSDHRARI